MSAYFPFDSLIRLTDFDDLPLSRGLSTRGDGHRQTKGTAYGSPRLDLIEDKENLTAIVECPGLKKENVDISLHDNILTISGSNAHETTSQPEGSSYRISERHYGSFARSLAVPPGLKESEIKATLEEGLLRVTLPKRAKDSEAKKITIG